MIKSEMSSNQNVESIEPNVSRPQTARPTSWGSSVPIRGRDWAEGDQCPLRRAKGHSHRGVGIWPNVVGSMHTEGRFRAMKRAPCSRPGALRK